MKGMIVDGWATLRSNRHSKRPALQHRRLFRRRRQHFLRRQDGITNPVVPLSGCSSKQALTGASGATPGLPALNAACFGLPLLNPGDLNGAIPSNDPYETNFIDHGQRNIFRQAWQRRADLSVSKVIQFTERFCAEVSDGYLQPDQHREFRHSDRRRQPEH